MCAYSARCLGSCVLPLTTTDTAIRVCGGGAPQRHGLVRRRADELDAPRSQPTRPASLASHHRPFRTARRIRLLLLRHNAGTHVSGGIHRRLGHRGLDSPWSRSLRRQHQHHHHRPSHQSAAKILSHSANPIGWHQDRIFLRAFTKGAF